MKITVYDMLGNDITTLVNSDFEAGSYTVNWDATGRNGNAAASGVYLYKIEAGTFTSVKKMALVR